MKDDQLQFVNLPFKKISPQPSTEGDVFVTTFSTKLPLSVSQHRLSEPWGKHGVLPEVSEWRQLSIIVKVKGTLECWWGDGRSASLFCFCFPLPVALKRGRSSSVVFKGLPHQALRQALVQFVGEGLQRVSSGNGLGCIVNSTRSRITLKTNLWACL